MATIPLSQGRHATVDDADVDLLLRLAPRWHAYIGSNGNEYACFSMVDPEKGHSFKVRMHHVLLGHPLGGKFVDHINGDGLDNRRENLRFVTNSQNQANAKKRGGSSKYYGVSWNARKRKWLVAFMHKRKSHFVGYFGNEEEAARAYDRAAREVRGEYARLNFP